MRKGPLFLVRLKVKPVCLKAWILPRVLLLIIGFSSASAWAQACDGGASSQWVTATNWSTDTLPTASSNVVFDTTHAAISRSSVEAVNTLTFK